MPQLLKGMQTDSLPRNQASGSWRDGANFVVSSHPGSLTTEPGFTKLNLTIDLTPLGSIELGDGRTVVFTKDAEMSEVGILTSTSYQVLLRDAVLGFDVNYPITGEYQQTIKGEDIVVFTDNHVNFKILNLSRLGFALNADKSLVNPEDFVLANVFAPVAPADFLLLRVGSGGQLLSGTYSFSICYEDLSGFTTKWLPVSRKVDITDEGVAADYTIVDGVIAGTMTNKSIQMQVTGMDTRYAFVRIACVRRVGQVVSSYEFARLPVENTTLTFNHSGSEGTTVLTNEEVLIPGPEFIRVKTVAQLQDELFIAGLQAKDVIDYQAYANNIKVDYLTHELDVTKTEQSYKNPLNSFYFRHFLCDEVYALYLVFRLKSGGLSPAFHIPGRQAAVVNESWNTNQLLENMTLSNPSGNGTAQVPFYNVSWDEDDVGQDGSLTSLNYQRFYILSSGIYPDAASVYTETNGSGVTQTNNIGYDAAFTEQPFMRNFTVSVNTITVPTAPLGAQHLIEDAQLGNNVKYFQTRDTSDNPSATSNLSFWENEDDYYANDASSDIYDATGKIGSLANQRVRHHKMPSLRSVGYGNAYGQVKAVGIKLSNVYIPPALLELVDSYEVYYAKRDLSNATVVGQSLLNFGANTLRVGENIVDSSDTPQVSSTGGMWNYYFDEDSTPDKRTDLRSDHIRMSPPDMLFNQIQVAPTHITNQMIVGNFAHILNQEEKKDENSTLVEVNYLNTTNRGATQVYPSLDQNYLFRLSEPQLLIGNTDPAGIYNNQGCETSFAARITKGKTGNFLGLYDTPSTNIISKLWLNDYVRRGVEVDNSEGVDFRFFATNPANSPLDRRNWVVQYVSNLNVYRTNVYSTYKTQRLVGTGVLTKVVNSVSADTFGGDCFIGNYGMRTVAPNAVTFNTSQEYGADPNSAIKTLYHYVVESAMNIALRHQDTSSPTASDLTVYYPKVGSDFVDSWLNQPATRNLSIGYNNDYSALNELSPAYPFLPDTFIGYFPNRIHRSRVTQRESQLSSWKNFPVNDYYDMPRNRGPISNLAVWGSRLLIHTERSLYRTLNKLQLDTKQASLTLGSGDIFQLEPEELIYAKSGYAGTTLRHCCLITKLGYFFASQTGKVFLVNDSVQEISNRGMSNFFHELLFGQVGDNPFQLDGAHMVWDEEFNRLLFTYNSVDTSWTLSYSADLNAWAFRHDYLPGFYTSSGDVLLSIHEGSVYRHHTGLPGVFYGATYPAVIEVVDTAPVTATFQNIHWETEVVTPNERSVYDDTFDKLLCYTHEQCSEELPVRHLAQGRMVEGVFFFNNLRDVTRDYTTPFMENRLLDRRLLLAGINPNKPWYKRSRFNGRYLITRLSYSNESGNTLSLHTVDAQFKASNRLGA